MNTSAIVMNILFGVMIIFGFFMMRYRLIKLREMSELGRPLLSAYVAQLTRTGYTSASKTPKRLIIARCDCVYVNQ